uniref:Uncharacterized protein n=1 Tax=Populus trichocarpa TaxID=3694 RepID=A0A2K1Z467_POPTR
MLYRSRFNSHSKLSREVTKIITDVSRKIDSFNFIFTVKKSKLSFCFSVFSAIKKESISISLNLMTKIRKV